MTLEQFGFKRVSTEQHSQIKKQKIDIDDENNVYESDMLKSIPISWQPILKDEFKKDYFKTITRKVTEDRKKNTVYPPMESVFSFLKCDINDIRVVIIGQDPYHGVNQACGLAFSVSKTVKIPPSLRNIYQELKSDLQDFTVPSHGDLSSWVTKGVFLLNAALTVRSASPNSHKEYGWYSFTDAIIKIINELCENVVFMLWGAFAEKKQSMIDKKKHLILISTHPSPFSAHKGFLGCKHFSKANLYLTEKNKGAINWNVE